MDRIGKFYRVTTDLSRAPLRDHLWHGYTDRWDFRDAIRTLARRWKDRVGECVGERNGFLLLRFHDTPGGLPDEEWLPDYLLQPTTPPPAPESQDSEAGELERELDLAFGFD